MSLLTTSIKHLCSKSTPPPIEIPSGQRVAHQHSCFGIANSQADPSPSSVVRLVPHSHNIIRHRPPKQTPHPPQPYSPLHPPHSAYPPLQPSSYIPPNRPLSQPQNSSSPIVPSQLPAPHPPIYENPVKVHIPSIQVGRGGCKDLQLG
jgi:hypothetical protein